VNFRPRSYGYALATVLLVLIVGWVGRHLAGTLVSVSGLRNRASRWLIFQAQAGDEVVVPDSAA